jgi:hypothetical protein|tara:strand:+ start:930 stop:1847 length:918 start_codon:yes stop_codon:yes gene_type:complete
MAYIGNQPTDNFVTFATQNFSTSATSSYTLSHAVSNENEIALFINNVRQHPGSGKAYTASGTALTLSANTASTDVMYCIFLGRAIQSTVPATNSITAAMVSANAVTGAKLNTDVISAQTALAAEPADTDEFLVSDAGVLKRIDYSLIKGGGITMADNWRITADIADTGTVTANWERNDKISSYIGSGMSESSGVFTFPSTGIYFVSAQSYVDETYDGALAYCGIQIMGSTNGSSISSLSQTYDSSGAQNRHMSLYCSTIYDVTNTSNNNIRLNLDHSGTSTTDATYGGNTNVNYTALTFIRLGDT